MPSCCGIILWHIVVACFAMMGHLGACLCYITFALRLQCKWPFVIHEVATPSCSFISSSARRQAGSCVQLAVGSSAENAHALQILCIGPIGEVILQSWRVHHGGHDQGGSGQQQNQLTIHAACGRVTQAFSLAARIIVYYFHFVLADQHPTLGFCMVVVMSWYELLKNRRFVHMASRNYCLYACCSPPRSLRCGVELFAANAPSTFEFKFGVLGSCLFQ